MSPLLITLLYLSLTPFMFYWPKIYWASLWKEGTVWDRSWLRVTSFRHSSHHQRLQQAVSGQEPHSPSCLPQVRQDPACYVWNLGGEESGHMDSSFLTLPLSSFPGCLPHLSPCKGRSLFPGHSTPPGKGKSRSCPAHAWTCWPNVCLPITSAIG